MKIVIRSCILSGLSNQDMNLFLSLAQSNSCIQGDFGEGPLKNSKFLHIDTDFPIVICKVPNCWHCQWYIWYLYIIFCKSHTRHGHYDIRHERFDIPHHHHDICHRFISSFLRLYINVMICYTLTTLLDLGNGHLHGTLWFMYALGVEGFMFSNKKIKKCNVFCSNTLLSDTVMYFSLSIYE